MDVEYFIAGVRQKVAELCGCNDELIRPLFDASSTALFEPNPQKEQDELNQKQSCNHQPTKSPNGENIASHNSTRRNSLNTPSNSLISISGNNGNKNFNKGEGKTTSEV